MKKINRILFAAFATCVAQQAEARLYNYEDLPLGPRSSGMGNTAMALSDDVGSVYFNPAVLAWSQGDQLSAGVSAYSRIDTRTGAYVTLFESAADNVTRGGFLAVPAMVGGFFKKPRWTWGGAVFVPNSFVNSGNFSFSEDSKVNYQSLMQDIWVSAFGAYELNDTDSIALGGYYLSRLSSEKFSFVKNVGGNVEIEFIEKMWDVTGFTGILGFSRKHSPSVTWGVSFRLPVLLFGALGNVSNVKSGSTDIGVKEFKPRGFPVPARLSAGCSYSWKEGRTFATDLHLYAPLKMNLHPDDLEDFAIDLRVVPSLHFGYEHFFRKALGMRLGYYTNISAARRLAKGLSAIHDRVNMYGATAALVFVKDTGEVSLGGWAQGGQGRAYSLDPESTGDVPRSNYFYGGVVASSYRF